ncbi:GNAT family N-acetyltransferase [Paraburkholderia solisilvae]|uniref:N-acetyltransferase domain-containing protein n=1 Tax=Paraburkholderia solisilvae TaxID=624376 RepID=A0A6J5E284_9BURK|nr:GNAT family N-acetyltransferase [Paraburkholderia solisilvae]CAB3760443.1 hypothetical protein LMG29739_03390 [Paraburkholderia solisilvae]
MSALQVQVEVEAERGVATARGVHTMEPFASGERDMRSGFAASAQFVDQLADALANPALAAAWANAVVGYWEAELAAGRIDPHEPLYLLDLAPAQGRLAWLLLQALEERLPGSPAATLDYCYVVCESGDSEGGAAPSAMHGPWTRLATKHGFAWGQWRGAIGSGLQIAHSGLVIACPRNPVVLLAAGLFERQSSSLWAAHRGEWMQGRYAYRPDTQLSGEQDGDMLNCAWHAMPVHAMDAHCEPLAAHYVAQLPSAPLLLPVETLAMLDALDRFCSRAGYLLLAAAHGVCSEQQLRAGMLWPKSAWLQHDAPLPVNFHALAMYHAAYAATVYQRQLADDGLVVHAVWWRAGEPPLDERVAALRASLDAHHPDDSASLAASAEALAAIAPPDTLLALLRLSHHDSRVLARLVSGYGSRPLHLTDTALYAWRAALLRVAQRHLPDRRNPSVDQQLGLMAMHAGHWALARDVFNGALASGHEDVAAHYYVACCLSAAGYPDDAIAHVSTALELEPSNRTCAALYRALRRRDVRWRSRGGYRPALARDRDVCIEPLSGGHADGLLRQFCSDPHIAPMTNLPALASREQVLEWIGNEWRDVGRCSYAVVSGEWGPVGVVSYRRSGVAAEIYFWIGGHAQGAGLGSRAARLLVAQAAAEGVTDLFASAYADNVRSIRTLGRIGFERLIVTTVDDGQLHYHRSLVETPVPVADTLALFKRFDEAMNAPQQPSNPRALNDGLDCMTPAAV